MGQIAMINEKMVPFERLEPIYLDRAFYFGDGIYEVLRSYNGKIFALEEHLARCKRSLDAIHISGVDMGEVLRRIITAYNASGIADAKIYFHITRGSGVREHSWSEEMKPNFFLTVTALGDQSKEKENGINVSTYPDLRWKRCDIKSLNLLPNVLARQDAANKGCSEAILVDENGLITEGAGSSFFAIFGEVVQTAPLTANILPSITREYVIKSANNIGMMVREESIKVDAAKKADELFIAVTTKDIVGIVQFDGIRIGTGKVGLYTRRLMEEFLTFTR